MYEVLTLIYIETEVASGTTKQLPEHSHVPDHYVPVNNGQRKIINTQ
jgi:hypothetical protein